MTSFEFLILALAAYRWTRFLVYDDGLLDVFQRFRQWSGVYDLEKTSPLKRVLSCPFCTSLWVSLLIWSLTLYNKDMTIQLSTPFAIAGYVSLIYEVLVHREN